MKIRKNEAGSAIIEATIVFPVMFFVIIFLLYVGNAYYQKCVIRKIIVTTLIEQSAQIADPLLDDIEDGTIPAYKEVDLNPYRYIAGIFDHDAETQTEQAIQEQINQVGSGYYAKMEARNASVNVDYSCLFLYATLSADVSYKIRVPIKLLGASDYLSIGMNEHVEVPVSDPVEFIRNVDFVEDLVEEYTGKNAGDLSDKLTDYVKKVKEWLGTGE